MENKENITPPAWAQPVQDAMHELHVGQDDLAKVADVSRGSIGHYLKGRRFPRGDKLDRLFAFLDLDGEIAKRGRRQSFIVSAQYRLEQFVSFDEQAPDAWERGMSARDTIETLTKDSFFRLLVCKEMREQDVVHWATKAMISDLEELVESGRKHSADLAETMRRVHHHLQNDEDGAPSFFRVSEERESLDFTVTPKIALPHATLPIISSVTAGAWTEATDPFSPGDADEWEVLPGKFSESAFVLRVEGDSMTSHRGGLSIPDGAKVAVEPSAYPDNGAIVVAKLKESDRATIKKLVIDPPYRYLMPLNEQYEKITVTDDCHIIGVVKKVIQDL